MTSPNPAAGKLISLSAPEFIHGFNAIEIHYSNSGSPLGCLVVPIGVHLKHPDTQLQSVDEWMSAAHPTQSAIILAT